MADDSVSSFIHTKLVRIIYTDPDGTDSSSDEQEPYDSSEKEITKKRINDRIILEVNMEVKKKRAAASKSEPYDKKKEKQYYQKKMKKMVGIRMRKSGRFVSEIRNPFTRRRLWLGTFVTPQEASRAYLEKKKEFKRLKEEWKLKARVSRNSGGKMDGSDSMGMKPVEETNEEPGSGGKVGKAVDDDLSICCIGSCGGIKKEN